MNDWSQWEKLRARGFLYYLLVWGVLVGGGISTAIELALPSLALPEFRFHYPPFTAERIVDDIIESVALGVFIAVGLWVYINHLYKRDKQRSLA